MIDNTLLTPAPISFGGIKVVVNNTTMPEIATANASGTAITWQEVMELVRNVHVDYRDQGFIMWRANKRKHNWHKEGF